MNPAQLTRTLQLMDSLFPVGAFAYSDGLETAAARGQVHDAGSLSSWLDHFLNAVFVPCDGLALLKCMKSVAATDWENIRAIDAEFTAMKPSSATRASSRSVGKRLLSTYASISGNKPEDALLTFMADLPQCNAAVAYGLVLSHQKLEIRDALLAFGYARMAGIVSAGLRLISLGQLQGQALLTHALSDLPAATERILQRENEPLRSFSPLVDIHQMNHQYVYSRLFRS